MKKIGRFIRSNIKVLAAFILGGIVLGGFGVYAAVASSSISYDNSTSGLSSTNVQGAIDELYDNAMNKSRCASNGTAVTFKVGDYVQMTPSKTSYTISETLTGYSTLTQTIKPNELNIWRVIRINSDGTVDMVSRYVSSTNINFKGLTGYKNIIGALNKLARQYENSCYTVDSRHMGYNGQTEYITDPSILTLTTAPQTSNSSSSNVTPINEAKGLGDEASETDEALVKTVFGTLQAYDVRYTSTANQYWVSNRNYHYSTSTHWRFCGYTIATSGSGGRECLYEYDNGFKETTIYSAAIRPIVTLKAGVKVSSGSGTSGSPYVLS